MIRRLTFEFGLEEKPVVGSPEKRAPRYVFREKMHFGKDLVATNSTEISEVLWRQEIGQKEMLIELFEHDKQEFIRAMIESGEAT